MAASSFPPCTFTAIATPAWVFCLERMAETGESFSALAARLPRFYRKFGQVAYEHGRLGPLMQALEESFPGVETDRSDGWKLIPPGAWIHVRASNTEPLLRMTVEAGRKQKWKISTRAFCSSSGAAHSV